MNQKDLVSEKQYRFVEFVELLLKIDKREEVGSNTEMTVLDKDGNEVKL